MAFLTLKIEMNEEIKTRVEGIPIFLTFNFFPMRSVKKIGKPSHLRLQDKALRDAFVFSKRPT